MNLLTVVIILLAVVAIAQVARVFEEVNKKQGVNPDEVTDADNNRQGRNLFLFMFLFLGACFYMTYRWWDEMLPKSASLHGNDIDNLMAISMGLIILVFLITQPLLFFFSYKYRGSKDRKAAYISHNNKLEVIWTSVPAVVLTVLILYGLNTWSDIMGDENKEGAINIELYAQQFNWTARYAGEDNQLGKANVRFIEGVNTLGVISKTALDKQTKDINAKIAANKTKIAESRNAGKRAFMTEQNEKLTKKRDGMIVLEQRTSHKDVMAAEDDIVTKELHLPVGKKVLLHLRSQDIIHSAYLPHFRVQMNCVPGMNTQFTFTPSVTTEEMRDELGDPEFDYVLLCNKICGAAHYNMQMKVIVESEEDYNKWLAEQPTFKMANLK